MDEPSAIPTPRRDDGFVELSLVAPMYNEEDGIDLFLSTVVPILESVTPDYEIICVNDGSSDRTFEKLVEAHSKNPRVKVVNLSRNFGKDLALSAGLDYASGLGVIPIDSDLQDPPELIPELVARWREGFDMVLAMRSDRGSDSFIKRTTANYFYKLVGRIGDVKIPPNVGDFRLIDRRVLGALALMPERTRFMKGIFAWLGFKQTTVTYARAARAAGTTKFRYWRLWNFALEGIASFTTLPLRVWSYFGFFVSLVAILYTAVVILRVLIFGIDVPGYASVMAAVLFFSGVNLMGLGIIGEYLGRVFIEVKQRPIYIVRDALGLSPALPLRQSQGPVAAGGLTAVLQRGQ